MPVLVASFVLVIIVCAMKGYRAAARRLTDRRMIQGGADNGGFGPFNELCRSGGYLSLLGMRSDDVGHVLRRIGEIVRSEGGHRQYIGRLLEDRNWRGQVIGLAAVLLSDESSSYASTLWRCFDRGSWVAPQLAVALYCSDPDFIGQAKRRILARCPIADDDGFFRGDSREASAKNLASLLRVLAYVPAEANWTASELHAADVQELLRADDASGEIVKSWFEAARVRFQEAGRHLDATA